MALALRDCRIKTIVDWTHEVDEDGERPRNPIRRGIITRVVGDSSAEGSVSEIWVLFKRGSEPQKIAGAELSTAYDASSKIARKAWDRIMGIPEMVGSERLVKHQERRRRIDEMGIRHLEKTGLVSPSQEREAQIDAMGFDDGDDVAVGGGETPDAAPEQK